MNSQKSKRIKKIDMLHGSVLPATLAFALPIAATNILQQLFNSADTAVVGQFADTGSLAAVGTNGEVVGLFVSIAAGLATGVNVVLSWQIGTGDKKSQETTIRSSLRFSLIAGLLMLLAGELLAAPILDLINVPDDVMSKAVLYLRLYLLGMPFLTLYDFCSAIMRARGDSRRPLYALVVSGILNVLLNLFFVIVLHMDVAGVSIATDISTAVSAFLLLGWLKKDSDESADNSTGISSKKIIRKILQIGAPAAVQSAVFCLANVVIQAAINSFGTDVVAGSAASLNFEYFSYYMVAAYAQTVTTFESQNYAAGQMDRCRKILWICLLSSIALSSAISIPCTIWRSTMARIYSSSPDVIREASYRMLLILSITPFESFFETPAGVMRGFGISVLPAIETTICSCGFRILWIFTVFQHFHTLEVLYLVYPFSWALTSIALWISLRIVCGQLFSRKEKQPRPSRTR